tara:strand:- start:2230 stop:2853 length:624 start_codon:yes stop_codon:yes gene_type:complete
MPFETNLTTYNFNRDTLDLLLQDGLQNNEIIDIMKTVGFSTELTTYLLNVPLTFYNSVVIRLKLYAKQQRDITYIKKALNKFTDTYFLVEHLFNHKSTEKNMVVEDVQNNQNNESVASLLNEDVVENNSDSDDELEDPLETFYQKFIIKDDGANLSYKESYGVFIDWFNENHNDETPGKKKFKKYLSDKLGKSNKNQWLNYSLNVTA